MFTKQTIFAVILLFLAASLFFFLQKIDFGHVNNKFTPSPPAIPPNDTNQERPDILGKTSQFIEDQSKKAARNLGDLLGEKARNTLENILPKSETPKVSPIDQSTVDTKAVTTIDLSKNSIVKLTLSKNNKYYLNFINVPANYCLYIGPDKYPIPQDKDLEIQFTSSGLFPLKANVCDLGDKNLGEITVE